MQQLDPVVSDTLVVHPTSTDTLAASSTSNDTVGNLSTSDGSKDTNPPSDSHSSAELPTSDPSDNVPTSQNSTDPTTSTSNVTSVITSGSENIDTDCEVLSTALFSATNEQSIGATPTATPRRNRSLKLNQRRNLSQGSLDSFLMARDSSLKRKPSSDVIISPTSDHVTKMTRSDGGDTKS